MFLRLFVDLLDLFIFPNPTTNNQQPTTTNHQPPLIFCVFHFSLFLLWFKNLPWLILNALIFLIWLIKVDLFIRLIVDLLDSFSFFQPINQQPTTHNQQPLSDLQIKSKITLKKLCRSGLTCYFCTRIETEITHLTHWKRVKDFTKIKSKNLWEFKN